MDLVTSLDEDKIKVVGSKPGEIFAIYIPECCQDQAKQHLKKVIELGSKGTSWQFYWSLNGMCTKLQSEGRKEHIIADNNCFIPLYDETIDFDYPEHYIEFLKQGYCRGRKSN